MKQKLLLATLILTLSGLTSFGQIVKKVLLEDHTAAWCGYCPRGMTTIVGLIASHPTNLIVVGNHGGQPTSPDGMSNTYVLAIDSNNTYGYPGGTVDRHKFSGETDLVIGDWKWSNYITSQAALAPAVGVNISSTYTAASRALSVTVGAVFQAAATGDMRISCVLVEDSVIGTGSGFDQHNYMDTLCTNPDPTSDWYHKGCSIAGFVHMHVARVNLAATWGDAGIIPASVPAGGHPTYNKTYTYTVPSTYDVSHMKIVAFISQQTTSMDTRDVMNSNQAVLGGSAIMLNTTGFSEQTSSDFDFSVFPNPSNGIFNIESRNSGAQKLSVLNILGATVAEYNYPAGYSGSKVLNLSNLSGGLYLLKVEANSGTMVKRITINK